MKTILNAFGFLAMLGGFYFVYKAIDATFILSGSSGSGASAVQISQIYNTGAYFGIMALVCFVFVLCCLVAAGQQKSE